MLIEAPNAVRRLARFVVHPVSALLLFGALCGLFVLVLHPWFMNCAIMGRRHPSL